MSLHKRPVLLVALLMILGACAHVPEKAKWAAARPVVTAPASSGLSAADRNYQIAAAAIRRGDYANALDLLQVARASAPDDVRVLDAFGVVYDKLGRFDLSARYYALAKAQDPGSAIVANNLAMSARMQAQTRAVAVMESASSDTSVRLGFLQDAELPLQRGPSSYYAKSNPRTLPRGLTGSVLLVINASGQAGGADSMRMNLAQLGWSAPKSAIRNAPRADQTTIRYPAEFVIEAQALARTLPLPARLVECLDCRGLSLVVGADARQGRQRAQLDEAERPAHALL